MKIHSILLATFLFPAALPAEEEVYRFEGETITDEPGKPAQSQNFIFTLTGDGDTDNCVWEIKEDSTAPSPKHVLAITKADAIDTSFPMALLKGKEKRFQDCTISVKFKITKGTVNQAAGIVFRAVDADHCYLARVSALDNSISVLRVNKKVRQRVATGKVSVPVNRWNALKITLKGTEMSFFLNDNKVLTAKDDVYPSGKVGLVTQEIGRAHV